MPVITAKVDATAAAAKLDALPARLHQGASAAVETGTRQLLASVQRKLSGEVLNARSGRLRASIAASVAGLEGSISSDVPYARIQEFGGLVNVPEMAPVRARALTFSYGGRLMFAARTAAHTVNLPERSYMRTSLAEIAPVFVARIRKIVEEAAA
jgi:phage gpG-like protein